MQQQPTCTSLRVRSPQDAQIIFHAVALGVLPMVTRRLDTEERRSITSGCVFVWEERGPSPEATGLGIERWTDGKRWGPSRVRDEFLFYQERDPEPVDIEPNSDSDTTPLAQPGVNHEYVRASLVKQTYSVFVETPVGRKKWHLIAYFTHDSLDYLRTVSDLPDLARIVVPPGNYRSARHNTSKHGRAQREERPHPFTPQYAAYPSSRVPVIQPPNDCLQSFDYSGRAQPRDGQSLAPLTYLQNLAPPRRHPLDEEALMAFYPRLC
ncbi:Gti1/Pac2 family-domain-containing protein [Suillus fuscotomentosus]|uniref:Gti1/Pac2 family-domain-containing protein n=1 Tax=Suillus fuscotomentosus TaxID=1912939 RepID=A0AAD4HMN7_9AGAM|nr:Gti1/Pac2 family-domain-containing protein [Suillus fuscotomentosus]KAG1901856.1 Gti1/Pac2 family-domain-containing protein [Suillus fuscotomentosus]